MKKHQRSGVLLGLLLSVVASAVTAEKFVQIDIKPSGSNPELSGSKLSLPISTMFNNEWGMQGSPGINLKAAWDTLVQKKTVSASKTFDCSFSTATVALIDTGVDFAHPNLKGAQWENKAEVNGKPGVDDDRNGFIDDKNGWDFTTNTATIVDGHGHGTHLAGIISGQSADALGFKGVCPGIKIMSLRYFSNDMAGLKNLENTVKAIRYAIQMGANIINYSGGGASYAHEEYLALKEATDKGILVVAAAGNERSNTEKRPYFPASYDLKNILSVAGVGQEGKLIPASNWGPKSDDVAAPGGGILSLQQNQSFGFMNGTSQATAFVSGIAGLVWSLNPRFKADEVKQIIQRSVIKMSSLKNKVLSEGLADASMAVKMALDFKSPKIKSKLRKSLKAPRILSGLPAAPVTDAEALKSL